MRRMASLCSGGSDGYHCVPVPIWVLGHCLQLTKTGVPYRSGFCMHSWDTGLTTGVQGPRHTGVCVHVHTYMY